ncbi:diacylglycerol/lipid kinase family protein [Flavobacterium alkalisoli]|uniref:diacylglycerol/lipid kinase family protein n=1 Tax=Flavobacterium alkalisoli TaxID=2602769 RepID=UPI003A934BE9
MKKGNMSSQKEFLIVVNPIAGGNDKTDLLEAVREFADKENISLVEYETTGKNDEEEIKKLYTKHKPERVLVAGGDGSVKMIAEAIGHEDVVIGVLPAGSANGLSVDLNLPGDVNQNLEIAFHGDFMQMDMVNINGKKSLHLSDIGVNAELIRNYEGSNIRGKLGYVLQAFNTLTELQDPFHAIIEANGNTLETEARMIVIANTKRYGTGVTINPIGKMDDGKFEIVILKSLDLIFITKVLAGKMPIESNKDVEIISTEDALITTDVPVCFQIDGEFCGEIDRLDIKILHKQMKIAVPKTT